MGGLSQFYGSFIGLILIGSVARITFLELLADGYLILN